MDSVKCRACFQELSSRSSKTSIRLSDPIQTSYDKVTTYLDAFMFCTGYSVSSSEPQTLCKICASDLVISFRFLKNCKETQKEIEKLAQLESKELKIEPVEIKIEPISVEDFEIFPEKNDSLSDDDVTDTEEAKKEPKPEKTRIECELCGKSYAELKNLMFHCKTKHSKDQTCPHCNGKFFKQFFKSHEEKCAKRAFEDKNPSKTRQYRCELCERSYTQTQNLNYHCRTKHKEEFVHVCPHCDRTFFEKTFKCHVEQCKSGMKFPQFHHEKRLCPICGVMKSETHIRSHIASQLTPKTYICDLCDANFQIKSSIKRHIKVMHLKKTFDCKFCNEKFNSQCTMYAHIRKQHSEQTKYKKIECNLCDFTTNYYNTLRVHRLSVHENKMLFKCSYCPKEFILKPKLKNHEATHLDERPFACEICGSTFKTMKYLTMHKRVHQERDYECPVCQRAFLTNQLMTLHVKSKHPTYQLPPPGTVMSKSGRKKLAEKKLREEAIKSGVDKQTAEAIVLEEAPPIEEFQVYQPYKDLREVTD